MGYHLLKDEIWEDPAATLLNLGTSLHVWSGTTALIAKYYSLGAKVDETGTIQRFTRERALVDMLRLAEQRAQELIDLTAEEEPVWPLFYYEVAQVWRQGAAEDQLWALYYNWQAIAEAQMMAYFAGFYGEAVQEALERTGRPRELLEFWDVPVQP